jgi:hypothetical protein
MTWLAAYDPTDGLVKPTVEDCCLLPIHFDADISEEPLGTTLPADYPFAQLVYSATDGTGSTLTLGKTYGAGTQAITTSKVGVASFAGEGATFTVTVTGGTKADFMVRLTKS